MNDDKTATTAPAASKSVDPEDLETVMFGQANLFRRDEVSSSPD